jgi:hypothetical protein
VSEFLTQKLLFFSVQMATGQVSSLPNILAAPMPISQHQADNFATAVGSVIGLMVTLCTRFSALGFCVVVHFVQLGFVGSSVVMAVLSSGSQYGRREGAAHQRRSEDDGSFQRRLLVVVGDYVFNSVPD